ncbi:MAG: hypothetical protein KJO38_12175 [Gammaproteobacteria bacterium]|nr:hypothetical protein [Gammaproteobacteria bacterium]
MTMNKRILSTVVILTSAVAAGNAAADGFAPWQTAGIDSLPDPVQLRVDAGPFYAGGLADADDVADVRQAGIDVSSWYAAARRLPVGAGGEVGLAAR